MKILCISPHLDDAILSCGQCLAGNEAEILTIFAGMPQTKAVLTAYDSKFGFESAEAAMMQRHKEDTEACLHVGATPIRLEYTDSQYGEDRDRQAIKNDIAQKIHESGADLIMAPLGLSHPDHILVRDLALELFLEGNFRLTFYEELPERVTNPEHVMNAKAAIEERVTLAYDTYPNSLLAPKLAALICYRSQLGGDINIYNLGVAERFWNSTKKEG